MKPICCGDRRDAEMLLAAGTDGLTIDEVNPVWSVAENNLRCLGVALISAPGLNDDIAAATNGDILTKILNVPLLSKL